MKLFFKITIVVFCFLFFGCKKQFDKDYYKDCVGEDSVEPYYYTLITPHQMDFFVNGDIYKKYILKNSVFEPETTIYLDDTLVSSFKADIKNKLNYKLNEQWFINLLNVDTAKQSIVFSIYFFYQNLGDNRKAYCSNHYHFEKANNDLELNFTLKGAESNRNERYLDFTKCIIVVDKFDTNKEIKFIQNETEICK